MQIDNSCILLRSYGDKVSDGTLYDQRLFCSGGFNEYLNIYRLKKANAMLLETPKRKIAEVAALCGFGDSNYFSKQYKKMYGISPTETRKDGT